MKIREFTAELWLPMPRARVFEFFADPANLDAITPPWLGFRTVTALPIEMREGALIDYRLRLHGLPIRWRSRISAWDPPHRFVDEQVRGPYRLWVHEHTFESQDDGTIVRDHVRYAVPFDRLVHDRLVRPDLERIFRYRAHQTTSMILATAGHSSGSGTV